MNQNENGPNNAPRKPRFLIYIVVLLVIAAIWVFSSGLFGASQVAELNYTQFNTYFENNQIVKKK